MVVASRGLRRDPALLAVGSLALACVVVSELLANRGRVRVPPVVYYAGIVLVLLIGAAAMRMPRRVPWIAAYVLVLAFIAHVSVGLRLPQRVLSPEPDPASRPGLIEFRRQLDSGELPDTQLIVVDNCLKFAVPYYVRRPTIAAITERELGFEPASRWRDGPSASSRAGRRAPSREHGGAYVCERRVHPRSRGAARGTSSENAALVVFSSPPRPSRPRAR